LLRQQDALDQRQIAEQLAELLPHMQMHVRLHGLGERMTMPTRSWHFA
jgi:hypothetical protein